MVKSVVAKMMKGKNLATVLVLTVLLTVTPQVNP